MKDLIHKRKWAFRQQCLKYLRYVLNDHFVLFLLVFLGFLAYQYQEFLASIQVLTWPYYLILVLLFLLVIPVGKIALYLERPDRYFLLVSEEELLKQVRREAFFSYLRWTLLQTGMLLLSLPLWLKLELPAWAFALALVVGALVKYVYMNWQCNNMIGLSHLNWDQAIAYEEKRKQSILRFFSLFTNVKGVSNSVKRRKYLDPVLKLVPKTSEHTWTYLYLRSYLRNGDLFALTVRLLILALLLLGGLASPYLLVAALILVNYLLVFQLFGLHGAFDYQLQTKLFPLEGKDKRKGLLRVLRLVTGFVFAVQIVFSLLLLKGWIPLAGLILGGIFFQGLYMPWKIRGLVDEGA